MEAALLQHHTAQWRAEAKQLASQIPPESYDDDAPAQACQDQDGAQFLTADVTAQLLGLQLPQQLRGLAMRCGQRCRSRTAATMRPAPTWAV
jgi:hypothetical protein